MLLHNIQMLHINNTVEIYMQIFYAGLLSFKLPCLFQIRVAREFETKPMLSGLAYTLDLRGLIQLGSWTSGRLFRIISLPKRRAITQSTFTVVTQVLPEAETLQRPIAVKNFL